MFRSFRARVPRWDFHTSLLWGKEGSKRGKDSYSVLRRLGRVRSACVCVALVVWDAGQDNSLLGLYRTLLALIPLVRVSLFVGVMGSREFSNWLEISVDKS